MIKVRENKPSEKDGSEKNIRFYLLKNDLYDTDHSLVFLLYNDNIIFIKCLSCIHN